MKSFVLLLFCLLSATGCFKTKTVVAEGLPEPPSAQPEGNIPPIADPGDGILQNDEVEAAALDNALKLLQADVRNTVWLSAADDFNEGRGGLDALKAGEMGINLLSNRVQLARLKAIDKGESVFAFDLRDAFGNRANEVWRLIEDQAVIQLVSQTVRFKNLQFLTQKRIPLMHMKVFLETAFKAQVYYAIKQVPLNEFEFWAGQGVNEQQIFDDRDKDIFLAGFEESQIAPGHNRFVRRVLGNNGPCYKTFDVDSLFIVPESNFFKFPFPREARSQNTFVFNAGEILCIQPNGHYLMALYNAQGIRQDAAPTTVVVNTRTTPLGLDPSITIRDCEGCHTSFVLPYQDEIGRSIETQPFGAQDKLLGQLFFKPAGDLENVLTQDNGEHANVLSLLGIQAGGAPPMNSMIDRLRDGVDAKELASFLYLSEAEFLRRLSGSLEAQQDFGNLLNGGTVGFFTVQAGFQGLIEDLNLFRDIN